MQLALDLGMANEDILRDKYYDPLRSDPDFERVAAEVRRCIATK